MKKRLANLAVIGDEPLNDWMPKSQRFHHLRLRASNGQILAHSESYPNPANARRARKALLRAFAEVLIREGWVEAEQVKWGAP